MSISSMEILGLGVASLKNKGGLLTAREIAQQPLVWGRVQALVAEQSADIDAFLAPLLADKDLRIILTGAGTSAFVGQCLAPLMLQKLDRRVEAIPTTDLVSEPQQYFQTGVTTLLVSFARSGSSPESVAAVELADQMLDQVHHLFITCNVKGELYRRGQQQKNVFSLLLPDETHDRGFAMTSSFTSMLLSAACIFGIVDRTTSNIAASCEAAEQLMSLTLPLLNALVKKKFKRVVYLGSNELKGLAQEAALKLLELSDGQTVAVFDSPLGFRHGPKTIVDNNTLVVLFMSNQAHARRYERDLLQELRSDGRAGQVLALTATNDFDSADDCVLSRYLTCANGIELALPYIVFAQIFAFLQSLSLNIKPDTPSVSGTVNRVVSGVTIYPIESESVHVSRN